MRPRVLYITGWCRSGSTVLGNLLNEVEGVVHVGELHYLWANGVLEGGTNSSCGCGRRIRSCPLWSKVLSDMAGEGTELAHAMVDGQQRWLRTRHSTSRLAEAAGGRTVPAGLSTVLDRTRDLYRAVARRGEASVIVDSSKYPAEAAALCGRSDLDVRVLHLVRDPRATAESWRRAKEYIPAMNVWRSGSYWTAFNLASERIGRRFPDRYLRLTYESFTSRPQQELATVMEFAGLTGSPPIAADGTAFLGTNHTVTGNPDRLRQGPVTVAGRAAGRSSLSVAERLLATLLAAPALRRYGYGPF